jgi:glutamate formiminotransferase/formiminotetrahydrofolate cyclodeaminase
VLLDIDPGAATNRTVVTFLGPPEAVEQAAFRAIRKAAQLIDMSKHRGEHPRLGATDVCPFVPVEGATMDDCVEIARRLGRRVGEELDIPVFLYEHAATRPERRSLADIRQGEYEGLAAKLAQEAFRPDFGPAVFDPKAGATVIGARPFLIAYNVNLDTKEKKLANRIAEELRETGKPDRAADGSIKKDASGNTIRLPGRFQNLRGVGWFIEEYGRAQISFNFTDYTKTPIHTVFDACCEEAAKLGVRATGSELVGLIPLGALLSAGDHYLARQGRSTGVPEAERVHAAVLSLGLGELAAFDPGAKIIEYRYRGRPKGLASLAVRAFTDELSVDSPAPGGGSVAALCGALSAALASMVAALTWSKKGMEATRPAMDTDAFNDVIAARRLPKATEAQQAARAEALRAANLGAAQVPLEVLEASVASLELALRVAREGNPASASDAGVAGLCALAAAEGASLNVRINLPSIEDAAAHRKLESAAATALGRARELAAEVRDAVESALAKA